MANVPKKARQPFFIVLYLLPTKGSMDECFCSVHPMVHVILIKHWLHQRLAVECISFVGRGKGASIYDVRSGWGRGSPKSRRKEQNQLICDSGRGEGVKKSEIFADVIVGSPLILNVELLSAA